MNSLKALLLRLFLAGAFSLFPVAADAADPRPASASFSKSPIKVTGLRSPGLVLKEEAETVLLGNERAEFLFSKRQGGILVGMRDKAAATPYSAAGETVRGEWTADLKTAPFLASQARYEGGEAALGRDEIFLRLRCSTDRGQLVQTFRLKKGAPYLIASCEFENRIAENDLLNLLSFTLSNIAIGGTVDHNEFIYPPTWLHLMKGPVKEATRENLTARYIYGSDQPTDKLMLPYTLIYNTASGKGVALAAVDRESKVYVGVLGGKVGSLNGKFSLFRTLKSKENHRSGDVIISLLSGGWEQAMLDEKAILMKEAGFGAPKHVPSFVKDLVIVWHGIPGVGVNSYDDLARELAILHEAGANAMIVGGKVWHCPASNKGAGTIFDYIPLPQNGMIGPADDVGGLEGLKRLVAKAHELDMKLFTWGPASMAGIARQSEEATSKPDWWIYQENGEFNDWYKFMVPANPASEGWRQFMIDNVKRIITDYGVDGFWLDSSWQDHQLNHKAVDGWLGAPNARKLSLVDEIVTAAKTLNKECVVMAEVSGAEFMSRVDIAYLQVHGIWPALPPRELQQMIVAQELNRLPGVRPFGQIELGQGFYLDLADETSRNLASEYSDSWIPKTFLVSTLDRVPVYFGLSWGIALLQHDEKTGAEDNPDLIKARAERKLFDIWFDLFKRVNRVRMEHPEIREGRTLFGFVQPTSDAIIHYLRQSDTATSVVLLNAARTPEAITVKFLKPEALGIRAGEDYTIINLMNQAEIKASGDELLTNGLKMTLDGYEGAILKVRKD